MSGLYLWYGLYIYALRVTFFEWRIVIPPFCPVGDATDFFCLFMYFFLFFTALAMILLSDAVVFLGLPVHCLLLTTTVVSLFFRKYQIVVLAKLNVCAMTLIDFHSSKCLIV